MKIYVVLYTCDSWQGDNLFGVYSSPEKAKEAIEAAGMGTWNIEPKEVELDSPIRKEYG